MRAPEEPCQTEAEASPWHEAPHSRIRLLSASGLYYQGKPVLAAAIEIVLDEGWKTYWRSPGEGLPPALDWKASDNLAEAAFFGPRLRAFAAAEGPPWPAMNGRSSCPSW